MNMEKLKERNRKNYKKNITLLLNWLNIYLTLKNDIKIKLTDNAIKALNNDYINQAKINNFKIEREIKYMEKCIKQYKEITKGTTKNEKISPHD